MKITQGWLHNILPDPLMKSVRLPNAYRMAKAVGRYYCTPMTLAGKCPRNCEGCRKILEQTVETMKEKNELIQKPAGVFVYRLRNLVNDAVETKPTIGADKDEFGIPVEQEGNVWDRMLAGL